MELSRTLEPYSFFSDSSNFPEYKYYLVNFQEKKYMKITKESPYYDLCFHLYCRDWAYAESNFQIISTYEEVFNLDEWDS